MKSQSTKGRNILIKKKNPNWPIKNRGKDLNRHIIKNNIQMTSKQQQTFLTRGSLAKMHGVGKSRSPLDVKLTEYSQTP
jgi:hypothetical protein